jgi:hypothetical protein
MHLGDSHSPRPCRWFALLPLLALSTLGRADVSFVSTSDGAGFVVEAEAAPPVEAWRLEHDHTGYSGAGYLAWRGPHVKHRPGTAVLSYAVMIDQPGRYRLSIRARRDQETPPRATDQVNDVFVRFAADTPWIKVSHRTVWGEWGWMRHFSFESGLEEAIFLLPAGRNVLEMAARSDNVKVDRLHLEGPLDTGPALAAHRPDSDSMRPSSASVQ